jgi:hypothetical protein
MNSHRLLFSAAILSLAAALPLRAAEDVEPPINYTLKIGDQSTRLVPGTESEVKGNFTNPKVTLVPDEHRTFTYGGVTFSYPSNFAFEADFSEKGLKSWTLDGSDCVIMLHRYETEKVTPKELMKSLKEAYGKNSRIEPVTHTFNGKEYSGMRIHASLADTKFFQDVIALPSEKGSCIMILQDLPTSAKVSDAETKQVMKLLNETLKL